MDSIELIELINVAIIEVEKYIKKYNLPEGNQLTTHTTRVLRLLKEEVAQHNFFINERVLRGFKDICTTTAIQYEHTSFNDPIFDINDKLEKYVSNYTQLELLRMDFGKGNPI